MANTTLFQSGARGRVPRATDVVNEAGGRAYDPGAKHALAQYAVTGTFNHTFYTKAEQQLATALELASKVDAEFLAKLAVYSREKGQMKDMPAFLCAVLAGRKEPVALGPLKQVFPRVIDNAKMVRNFVQIVRSGATGRKSFGTASKRLVEAWFEGRTGDKIFLDSVGQKPSIADVIRLVHPKPTNDEQRALFAYLLGYGAPRKNDDRPGKERKARPTIDVDKLPLLVRQYEAWKKDASAPMPALPFQMLTSSELTTAHWTQIAKAANWHTLRMNLNTFKRHGVLDDKAMVKSIASRLRDPETLAKVRTFPYQLLATYTHADVDVEIKNALQDALEIVTGNVPKLAEDVYVCVDVSGSMDSAVTGDRGSATSKVRCVDVASLFGSCILRTNGEARVIPFNGEAFHIELNPRDSVMTNAKKISDLVGGGTDCAAPLRQITGKVGLIVMISDNMSWVESPTSGGNGMRGTGMAHEWARIRAKNPKAKLVCHDIAPGATVQVYDEKNAVMNTGGYSDTLFEQIAAFVRGEGPDTWVKEIEAISI